MESAVGQGARGEGRWGGVSVGRCFGVSVGGAEVRSRTVCLRLNWIADEHLYFNMFVMKNLAQTVEELQVYQRSFEFQQAIFVTSRLWPIEERFALIDQVRRSSRSIGANMSEAWAKRRYPAHFLSK